MSGAPPSLPSLACRRKCKIIYLSVYGACSSVMGLLSPRSHLLFVSVPADSPQRWSFFCLLPSFCPRVIFWHQLRLRITVWGHRYQTIEGYVTQAQGISVLLVNPNLIQEKKNGSLRKRVFICLISLLTAPHLPFSQRLPLLPDAGREQKLLYLTPHRQSVLALGNLSWSGSSEF